MKISAKQKAALVAAGYKVGKSGSTIQNRDGATVGGYNENGKLFGSGKALSILKAPAEAAPKKEAPKVAAKPKPKPQAKASSPRPKAKPVREASATKSKTSAPKVASNPPARPVSPTPSRPKPGAQRKDPAATARMADVTKAEYSAMSRGERQAKGLPVSPIDYIQAGGKTALKGGSGTKPQKDKPWWEKGIQDVFGKKDKK